MNALRGIIKRVIRREGRIGRVWLSARPCDGNTAGHRDSLASASFRGNGLRNQAAEELDRYEP